MAAGRASDTLGSFAGQVCTRFGLGRLVATPVEAARGQQGVVWHFRTTTGTYAVKDLLERTDEPAAALPAMLAERFADHHADPAALVVPRPVRTTEGRVLAEVGGHQVRVSTWVDLAGPACPDLRIVGTLVAGLHRDPLPVVGPVDPWYVEGVDAADWDAVASALSRVGAPFAREFAAFASAQLELQTVLSAPVDLQLCHRDLWLENLPPTRDGRICVLDLDKAGAAEPGQELAMPVYELCADEPARAGSLVAAYRDAGGPGRLDDAGSFTMVVAQLGHFAVTAGRRWLTAGDEAGRTRMEAWFREGDDQPLTSALIDRLLEASGRSTA